jgi:hypothetical protein
MRRIGIFISLAFLLLVPTAVFAVKVNQIQVLCQIFRIKGVVQDDISEDKDLWIDDLPGELKGMVKIFSKGSFDFGEDELEFKKGKCYWNDKEMPIAASMKPERLNSKISRIFSPEIVLYEHSSGNFKIEATQPIQYFSKRPDGLFELKEMELSTGLDIEITKGIEDEKEDDILLSGFKMTIRSVEKREPIEGVNLSVGKPILGELKYEFSPRLDPGEDYGILIKPKSGRGALLLRLRANSTNSGTYTPKAPENKQSNDK